MPPNLDNSTYQLEWWIEGALMATVPSRETADGYAYICEACDHSKPWAFKYFPNRALIRIYGACRNHPPDRREVPGSLVLWFKDEMDTMPDVLIEREFDLHLAYYERIQREQTQSGDTRPSASHHPRIDTAGILAELETGSRTTDHAGA